MSAEIVHHSQYITCYVMCDEICNGLPVVDCWTEAESS